MCGIFGATIEGLDLDDLRNARDTLTRRGPDQFGEFYDQLIYLGHRRLSIIDLSENGRQPMVNEEHGVSIVVNGEIYNFQAIRNELQKEFTFYSSSDSEVVLYGYIKWGAEALLKRLEGIYALAIYDQRNRKLILARDRIGVKPLYYCRIGNHFAFASELSSIESLLGTRLSLDTTAVFDFLTYFYIPTPKTIYNDVFKLEPASILEFEADSGRFTVEKYWELDPSEVPIGAVEAAEELKLKLSEAISDQLVSDVPVSFFLSGGLDSSVLVRAVTAGPQPGVKTISMGFDIADHDETEYANQVASLCETSHTVERVQRADGERLLGELRNLYSEPFGDTSAIPSFCLSQAASKHGKVAFSGDGGDELFGGYRWYERAGVICRKPLLDLNSVRLLSHVLPSRYANALKVRFALGTLDKYISFAVGGHISTEKGYYRDLLNVPDDYDSNWYLKKFYRSDLPPRKRLQYMDFHTYLNDAVLTKIDRVSMANGLEVRVPFLATKLVEFAFSLPESVTYHGGQLKGILKLAYGDSLPDNIVNRPKRGFGVPDYAWQLRPSGRTRAEHILDTLFPEVNIR